MKTDISACDALQSAIDTAGSQTKLASSLGISPQAVQQWVNGFRLVPANRAIEIEILTGVKRELLRPDIFA